MLACSSTVNNAGIDTSSVNYAGIDTSTVNNASIDTSTVNNAGIGTSRKDTPTAAKLVSKVIQLPTNYFIYFTRFLFKTTVNTNAGKHSGIYTCVYDTL
jgi:short-subunit dehydrogenase